MTDISSLPVDKGLRPLKVLFAGHPDVGKSTLIGRLLQDNGAIFQDQRKDNLAQYTDGLSEEVVQGITIDTTYRTVILRNSGLRLHVIDSPGHSEYIHNFVGGLSSADVVFHLIDSTRPGLTSEHLRLIRRSGKPVFHVLTKVDSPSYSDKAAEQDVDFRVDAVTGTGITTLELFLQSRAANLLHL